MTGGSVVVAAGWPAATGVGLVDGVDVVELVDGAANVTVASVLIDAGATVGMLGVGGDETAVPHPETRSSPATAPVSRSLSRLDVCTYPPCDSTLSWEARGHETSLAPPSTTRVWPVM